MGTKLTVSKANLVESWMSAYFMMLLAQGCHIVDPLRQRFGANAALGLRVGLSSSLKKTTALYLNIRIY